MPSRRCRFDSGRSLIRSRAAATSPPGRPTAGAATRPGRGLVRRPGPVANARVRRAPFAAPSSSGPFRYSLFVASPFVARSSRRVSSHSFSLRASSKGQDDGFSTRQYRFESGCPCHLPRGGAPTPRRPCGHRLRVKMAVFQSADTGSNPVARALRRATRGAASFPPPREARPTPRPRELTRALGRGDGLQHRLTGFDSRAGLPRFTPRPDGFQAPVYETGGTRFDS